MHGIWVCPGGATKIGTVDTWLADKIDAHAAQALAITTHEGDETASGRLQFHRHVGRRAGAGWRTSPPGRHAVLRRHFCVLSPERHCWAAGPRRIV